MLGLTLISTSNHLWLEFYSDSESTGEGFKLVYSSKFTAGMANLKQTFDIDILHYSIKAPYHAEVVLPARMSKRNRFVVLNKSGFRTFIHLKTGM